MRTRSPAIPGTGSPGSLLRILLALVACLGLTTPLMSQPASASESTLSTPGFETGDLSGWTATGTAFNGSVTDQPGWGWGCCFNQQGTYHLWGFAGGGDAPTGTVTSEPFTLTGTGMVSVLVSGGRNDDQLYVALTTLDGTILQDHAPLQRNPLRAERVHRCRRVSHAEGDAEQQLELRGDIQELADGVGVDAEYGLRDAGQPPGRQREQEVLRIHADVAGRPYPVAERRHEQERGMGSAVELQVLADRRPPARSERSTPRAW